jgi:MoaA/NifB/PqqE/SkfB family radical SAM enzyme
LKAKKIADTIEFLKRKLIRYRNLIIYKNINQYIPKEYGDKTKLLEYQKSRVTGPEPCVCHAPSRSLYIDMQGKFTACCFNRVYVFGRYPENNLQDIISGEKRKFLQKELCRSNFMYGCQHCHRLIESGNFEGTEARLYDTLQKQDIFPSEIIFELDNTCNLSCLMCHEGFSSSIARKKGVEIIKTNYDDNFFEQLKKLIPYLKVAKFLGGEPFLIQVYYRIWDLIIEINPKCKIILQTNGTIFTEKIRNYLLKGNFYIGVSIDSLNKEKFETIRVGADFEIVLKNLEEFKKISRKKNNYMNISVCPMLQNIYEIPKIIEFCNKNGFFVYFNTVYTKGFAINDAEEEHLSNIIKFLKSTKITGKSYIAKRNLKFYYDLIRNIENIYKQKENLSRPYKRNLRICKKEFYQILSLKAKEIQNIELDYDLFADLPDEFYISEKDKERLFALNPRDLADVLSKESKYEIRSRLMNFIEKGDFSKNEI